MNKLSIIIPVYNESKCLTKLYDNLVNSLKIHKVKYELLFIDDGSLDDSLYIIKDISKKNKNVYYYSLSKNFGKEAAMYCGLVNSEGNYVVIMDADLQHPPHVLVDMYKSILKSGKDSIIAVRNKKKSFIKKAFYHIISKLSKISFVDGETDFRIMSRRMVESILEVCERKRFSKGIFNWVGYDKDYYVYDDVERVDGESKWSFISLFKYALDGIVSFSNALLYLPLYISLLLFLINLLIIIILLINYSSLKCVLFVVSFLFMILFFVIGLFGLYLDNILTEVKNRPLYFIKESNKKN